MAKKPTYEELEKRVRMLENAESERNKAEEMVQENKKNFQIFFDTSPLAISLTEIDSGRFVDVNKKFCEATKFAKNEVLGKTAVQLGCYSENDRNRVIAELKNKGRVVGLEMDFKVRDGSIVNALMFDVLIQIDKKMLILTAFYDVTEQKQLESQLRQAQQLEAVGRLAGGVAHDLNNLLVPILGYSQFLLDDFGPDDARRKSVKQIINAGLKARDLVRQLLAFGRKQVLEYKPVDINQVIKSFENLLRRTIREDIAIEIILSPHISPVMADIGQIEQVIMNLAVNAADAMPEGGKMTIETELVELDDEYAGKHPSVEAGEFVMLAISDTGCGMDNETREHIFEPFFTTKGESGTGLGLATVYGIVKQHGGNIWVYSEPEKGTAFKVYLPVSENEPIEGEKKGRALTTDLKGSETILLVEDDEDVRYLANAILSRHGYTVLVAKNGVDALTVLEAYNKPVNLLLTDVVMPEMNGKDLFEKIAPKYPDIKVVYMSGYTNNIIVHHGILDNGVQFIQKPFTVEALAVKIREVLEQN